MKIAPGADHAGFELKEKVKRYLLGKGLAVDDHGTSSAQSVDYPDYAFFVAEQVAAGNAEYGILDCGTGIGMAIAANKVHGIRAAQLRRNWRRNSAGNTTMPTFWPWVGVCSMRMPRRRSLIAGSAQNLPEGAISSG